MLLFEWTLIDWLIRHFMELLAPYCAFQISSQIHFFPLLSKEKKWIWYEIWVVNEWICKDIEFPLLADMEQKWLMTDYGF